jgi:SAM-dependent methyltransferase
MNLKDIIGRSRPAMPWREGENIPWADPNISVRMLEEHLCQEHDSASRRFQKIDQQVAWIHKHLLQGRPSRILDLACGPGLYATRLARRGHQCLGIDYAPASIAYAVAQTKKERLACSYVHEDLRSAPFGSGYQLAMMIYGEFNVFQRSDATRIVEKARSALEPGGMLLLEVHTFDAVRKMGTQDRSWFTEKRGVFSDAPHICLREDFWDEKLATATVRYFVVDAATGNATRYAQTVQAYKDPEYATLLADCGFAEVRTVSSLIGEIDESQADYRVFVATVREW